MEEPSRIGLTNQNDNYLDEMLDSLQSEDSKTRLIKFDLIRLAVAWAIKNEITPEPPQSKTDSSYRVAELDPDKELYSAVESTKESSSSVPNYSIIEYLGNQGIAHFYSVYRKHKIIPWDKLLSD